MHQLVQSAIEAAKIGDKNRAIDLLKQVLNTNPNDVDAWLVLAAVMDDPQRKRQCLNRVLTLDPVNMMARDELLEMDRAAMGGAAPFKPEPSRAFASRASVDQSPDKPAPVSKPAPQPEKPYYSSGTYSFEPVPDDQEQVLSAPPIMKPHNAPQPKPSSKARAEKPEVFKYSIVTRIIIYAFAVIFLCSFALALQDVNNLLIPCSLFFIALPGVWIVSAQVEVSEKGIRTSRMFGLAGSQVAWDDIAKIKSNSMQSNLQLTTKKGNSIKVTSQVSGYPRIVEILRNKRPDLFGMAPAVATQTSAFSSSYDNESSGYVSAPLAPAFKGTRTFSKNFFKQYGLVILLIPFCFFAVWTAYTSAENRLGAILAAVFCLIMIVLPFFQVSAVKVEPNKIKFETLFEEKAFSAKQIREVKMQSVRGRYGRVTNYVNVVTEGGRNYPLQGFSDGDEIIYGFLTNWWNASRNG
jgi:hypothetical protein